MSGTPRTWADRLRLTPLTVGFRPLPAWTVCTGAVLLVAAAAPAASAWCTGLLVGSALPDATGTGALAPVVAALVAVFLVGQLATLLVATVSDLYGGALERTVEAAAIEATVTAPEGADAHVRALVDTLRDTVPVRQLVVATCQHLLTRGQAVLAGCLLVVLAPLPGLLVVASFLLCALLLESDYDREQGKAYSVADSTRRPRYLLSLAFSPAAAREIKIFGAADWTVERYHEAATADGDVPSRTSWPVRFAYAAVLLSGLVLLTVLARRSADGLPEAGGLAVCVSALTALTGIFAVTMNVVHSGRAVLLFARVRASGVLRPHPAAAASEADRDHGLPVPGEGSVVRFERVSFRYPGGEQVFDDLTFEVRLGRSLAVVGLNGAGKSTLVRLLTGVLLPDRGTVTCDGLPVGSPDDRPRPAFAYLGQHFVRYPATLDRNVTLAPGAPVTVREAARELVADLVPDAGPSPLLAKGVRGGVDLSGGQWQRVATARAVQALDPAYCRVLVLDEPTAALDAQAEARFFGEAGELAGPGNTTVMVSHRLSGVKDADEILVLDGGRIRERGDHTSLMRQRGRYADMFTAQARRYDD
ncbi:ATP-binding cassette domain-containing protein [Streptomyces pratensis]|uniref:ATP-binding cassette domain-containing protein n=1 Tax=Streptomyces pratensis TaxID=1169025 RepID=UPI003631B37F